MKIIVQKFGGNTLLNEKDRYLMSQNIIKAISEGYCPIIVVSAMGRKGFPYATDSLLDLVDSDEILADLREKDLLMSCGEIVSSVIISSYLRRKGLKTKALTGWQSGIFTNSDHTSAKILNIQKENLLNLLGDGFVPIVAGFQGISLNGDITTLGRGGSDTTAAAIGVALSVDRVEIFTDVKGIYTADPRVVSKAMLLDQISFTELFQMASHGSKVVHPRAVEIAMENDIELVVSSLENEYPGTIVKSIKKDRIEEEKVRFITALSHEEGLVQIHFPNLSGIASKKLYNNLAKNLVSLDLISVTPKGHYFVIKSDKLDTTTRISDELNLEYQVRDPVSKISCIGVGMHQQPGVFSQIITTLVNKDVDVIQTTDSHMTITCLIYSSDLCKALEALHEKFFTA
jgi:aspartate kinase